MSADCCVFKFFQRSVDAVSDSVASQLSVSVCLFNKSNVVQRGLYSYRAAE